MMDYILTTGNSNVGYTCVTVSIEQNRRGWLRAKLPSGYRRGMTAQHAQVLRSAALDLANQIHLGNKPGAVTGYSACGDAFAVQAVAV